MRTRVVDGRVYNYSYCIGRNAGAGTGLSLPLDFALGCGGNLYVISRGTEFVPGQGLTKCTLSQEFLWEDRGAGYGGGGSLWPVSVEVDSNETVYVSDDYDSLVYRYDSDGNYLGSWGTKGSGDGELDRPSGLAFDGEDNLYIVDSLNQRIQVFTKDGQFLAKWGSEGSGAGELNMPWGITVDKQGDVYEADWKNHRVQKFSPDGEYLATYGRLGTGDGELHFPSDVAVDNEGDVYVVDWGNHRLNIYAPDGAFVTAFTGDAQTLSKWSQAVVDANPDYRKARLRADVSPEWRFGRPVAVNVDDEGRIMVLEAQRGRIQIYVKERNFVDAPMNL